MPSTYIATMRALVASARLHNHLAIQARAHGRPYAAATFKGSALSIVANARLYMAMAGLH